MADILIRHYLIAIVMFCLVMVGGISMINELAVSNPTMTSDPLYVNFTSAFNRTGDITSSVNALQGNITAQASDPSVFGALGSLINTAWQSIKFFGSSFNMMNQAYTGLTTIFGIPAWMTALASILVLIIISFTIYSAIFQSEL